MTDDKKQQGLIEQQSEWPAIYEIRLMGLLDGDRWETAFEGMTIKSSKARGETVIIGTVRDQAALYGLLTRVRDLAVTLQGVRRLRRKPKGHRVPGRFRVSFRDINWLLSIVYLMMAGGFSAMVVFLTQDGGINTSLALALMFFADAALALIFQRTDESWGWWILVWTGFLGGLITLFIYLMIVNFVPVAMGLSALAFIIGGITLMVANRLRAPVTRLVEAPVHWEPIGSGLFHIDASQKADTMRAKDS